MFPIGSLNHFKTKNIVIFEKDVANPNNEGFISFWGISENKNYKLLFKQRLIKEKALKKWKILLESGWKKIESNRKAA